MSTPDRAALIKEARTIMRAAELGGRDLTPDENARMADLDQRISQMEAEEMRSRLAPLLRNPSVAPTDLATIINESRALVPASGDGSFLIAKEYADLVWEKAMARSILPRVPKTVFSTEDTSFVMARGTALATTAWTTAGSAITPSDPGYEQVEIVPRKVTEATVISSEVEADSRVLNSVLSGLMKTVANAIEVGFLTGNNSAPNPYGLAAVTGNYTAGGTAFVGDADLGYFAAAIGTAISNNIEVEGGAGVFVVPATVYAALLAFKRSTTDKAPLILAEQGVTGAPAASIFGIPLLYTGNLTGGYGYLLGADSVVEVRRTQPQMFRDPYSRSLTDEVVYRFTGRLNWAFDPKRIVKVQFTS